VKAAGDIYNRVPSTYIYAERDRAVPDIPQTLYAKYVAKTEDIIRIDSDHIPFLSHPKELAAAIRNAIAKALGK
jgi:pimeloyl-ACP methyl ester carboxylesterase